MDRFRSMQLASCCCDGSGSDPDALPSSLLWPAAPPLVSGEQLGRAGWSGRRVLGEADAAVVAVSLSWRCVLGSMQRASSLRLMCVFQ
jgi:hypothetical protein